MKIRAKAAGRGLRMALRMYGIEGLFFEIWNRLEDKKG